MLIDLNYLLDKYNLEINGILHVGAHYCEELPKYMKIGVKKEKTIWIEANQYIVDLKKHQDKELKIIAALITDEDDKEYLFNVTNNGQSSSIYEFGTHSKNHPEVKMIGKLVLKSKRLQT